MKHASFELSRSDLNASYIEFCEETFLGLVNSISENEKKKKKLVPCQIGSDVRGVRDKARHREPSVN